MPSILLRAAGPMNAGAGRAAPIRRSGAWIACASTRGRGSPIKGGHHATMRVDVALPLGQANAARRQIVAGRVAQLTTGRGISGTRLGESSSWQVVSCLLCSCFRSHRNGASCGRPGAAGRKRQTWRSIAPVFFRDLGSASQTPSFSYSTAPGAMVEAGSCLADRCR